MDFEPLFVAIATAAFSAGFFWTLYKGFQLAGRFVWRALQKWRGKQPNPWKQGSKQSAPQAPPSDERKPAPAGLFGEKGFLAWLDQDIHAAWTAWKAYRASFVLRELFGSWPRVRQHAPGQFTMKAPYIGPRRVQALSGWKPPVLTGAAFGALWWLLWWHEVASKKILVDDLLGGSLFVAGVMAAISIPFWRLARTTRLKIRFIDGAMIWRGPDWIKYRVQFTLDVPRFEGWLHRLGDEERRNHIQWQATHRGQAIPEPLFQTASEVLAQAPDRQWMPVAEFCNDLGQEWAVRLVRALDVVRQAAVDKKDLRKPAKAQQEQADQTAGTY